MGFFDNFKGKQYKNELDDLQKQFNDLQSLMTPEMKDAFLLKQKIGQLEELVRDKEKSISDLEKTLLSKKGEIESLEKTINSKKAKIVWMDDEILVQEFGLYHPQFDFASALDYKEELAKIRNYQKELIKREENGFRHAKTPSSCFQ